MAERPVDYDPFSAAASAAVDPVVPVVAPPSSSGTPVDHNPFASNAKAKPEVEAAPKLGTPESIAKVKKDMAGFKTAADVEKYVANLKASGQQTDVPTEEILALERKRGELVQAGMTTGEKVGSIAKGFAGGAAANLAAVPVLGGVGKAVSAAGKLAPKAGVIGEVGGAMSGIAKDMAAQGPKALAASGAAIGGVYTSVVDMVKDRFGLSDDAANLIVTASTLTPMAASQLISATLPKMAQTSAREIVQKLHGEGSKLLTKAQQSELMQTVRERLGSTGSIKENTAPLQNVLETAAGTRASEIRKQGSEAQRLLEAQANRSGRVQTEILPRRIEESRIQNLGADLTPSETGDVVRKIVQPIAGAAEQQLKDQGVRGWQAMEAEDMQRTAAGQFVNDTPASKIALARIDSLIEPDIQGVRQVSKENKQLYGWLKNLRARIAGEEVELDLAGAVAKPSPKSAANTVQRTAMYEYDALRRELADIAQMPPGPGYSAVKSKLAEEIGDLVRKAESQHMPNSFNPAIADYHQKALKTDEFRTSLGKVLKDGDGNTAAHRVAEKVFAGRDPARDFKNMIGDPNEFDRVALSHISSNLKGKDAKAAEKWLSGNYQDWKSELSAGARAKVDAHMAQLKKYDLLSAAAGTRQKVSMGHLEKTPGITQKAVEDSTKQLLGGKEPVDRFKELLTTSTANRDEMRAVYQAVQSQPGGKEAFQRAVKAVIQETEPDKVLSLFDNRLSNKLIEAGTHTPQEISELRSIVVALDELANANVATATDYHKAVTEVAGKAAMKGSALAAVLAALAAGSAVGGHPVVGAAVGGAEAVGLYFAKSAMVRHEKRIGSLIENIISDKQLFDAATAPANPGTIKRLQGMLAQKVGQGAVIEGEEAVGRKAKRAVGVQ